MADLYKITAGGSEYLAPETLDEVLEIVRAEVLRGEREFFIESVPAAAPSQEPEHE